MTRTECLKLMKAPGDKRGDACYGVMQIIITNCCDLGTCANCTQFCPYACRRYFMSLDNVRDAIDSVAEYPGVIGIMGGNPCIHPHFDAISEHLARVIPDKARRGLWTNNFNGHGDRIANTYGYFNLNAHGNKLWAAEMNDAVPAAKVWGMDTPSMHAPVAVSMRDMALTKSRRHDLIATCDINQRWSPAITEIKGYARGYFCEIAAAMAHVLNHPPETGVEIVPNWWRRPMENFAHQVDTYCHDCGAPLRLKPVPDSTQAETVSDTWLGTLAANNYPRADRAVLIDQIPADRVAEMTDYQQLRKHQCK